MASIKLRKRKKVQPVVQGERNIREFLKELQIPLTSFEDAQWFNNYLTSDGKRVLALETRTGPKAFFEVLSDAGGDVYSTAHECIGVRYVYY